MENVFNLGIGMMASCAPKPRCRVDIVRAAGHDRGIVGMGHRRPTARSN